MCNIIFLVKFMKNKLLKNLRDNIYNNSWMTSPFGNKPIIYADSTASGIIYKPIVEYMNANVYPFYSNTHSNAIYGKYMNELIEYSKKQIRSEYNCDDINDQIIFTGNGCTGAILHLIHAMKLKNTLQKIVVFVSITEHHSNYLPWKHLPVIMELTPLDVNGNLNYRFIQERMHYWKSAGARIIASFSGASNVSGVIEDWYKISKLVHFYDGIILWDMAACAPYVEINMHKNDTEGEYMDAIFVSPHKFLGGPGCPGLLIAHKKLFINDIPYCPGGGTVRFVCKNYQIYSSNIEVKETGGTPNILGCIQIGKVYELKKQIQSYINNKEHFLFLYVYNYLKSIKNLILIRPTNNIKIHSLPIFSFIINNYHYNLVVVLLNDVFGIQSRGGVSCCSVFAQNILHLDEKEQNNIYKSIENGKGVPDNYGWCRVSFHYTMTKYEVDYILNAINIIANYIHLLEDFYEYIPDKNNWIHKGNWTNINPSQRLFIHTKISRDILEENTQNVINFIKTFDLKNN